MAIKKFFNAFSPVEQIRTLYGFVWIQIIYNVLSLIRPNLAHKAIITSVIIGIYIVLIVARPSKLIRILKRENPTPHHSTHSMSIEAKFICLIFIIIVPIIISYF